MPQIINIGLPAPDATELTELQRAYTQATREAEHLIYGHGDFNESDSSLLASWKSVRYWDSRRLLALDDDADPLAPQPHQVLGLASVQSPLKENRELGYIWLWVTPEARGRGVGRALAAQVRRELADSGRTTVQVWRTGPIVPGDAPGAIRSETGFGAVDGGAPEIRWLTSLGFRFEQCERVSTLTIPGEGSGREDWRAAVGRMGEEARARADGYRIVRWQGRTPERYLEDFARLRRRMSVDIPSAGLTSEEQDVTPERVTYADDLAEARGMQRIVVAAEHESGALVAYTELQWPEPGWPGIWQEDTFVHGEHRGHRLGMWIKAEMLLWLPEVNPAAERIHTWNADENGYMLSINEALGFEPAAYESAWELRGIGAGSDPE
ncbi:MAG: GNAT family N-acetyltransferase [bacterium]|nr:GNAT family N-acetyltransferase [bacterium]